MLDWAYVSSERGYLLLKKRYMCKKNKIYHIGYVNNLK